MNQREAKIIALRIAAAVLDPIEIVDKNPFDRDKIENEFRKIVDRLLERGDALVANK